MAIPRKQIGWGADTNLLWGIWKALDGLTRVVSKNKPVEPTPVVAPTYLPFRLISDYLLIHMSTLDEIAREKMVNDFQLLLTTLNHTQSKIDSFVLNVIDNTAIINNSASAVKDIQTLVNNFPVEISKSILRLIW